MIAKLRRRFISLIMIIVLALAPMETLSAEDGSVVVPSEEGYAEETGAQDAVSVDITEETAAVSEEPSEISEVSEMPETPEMPETSETSETSETLEMPEATPAPETGESSDPGKDDTSETVLLTKQTVRAEFKDHKDYQTYQDYIRSYEYKNTLSWVNEIWKFMNDRKLALLTDVYPDSRLTGDALSCELEGYFPEGIKAEITAVAFEEEAGKYTENALAYLEIRLYDAEMPHATVV